MVKKTKSFAERAAAERKKPDSVHVKYVQSVLSEKTGHWRFNEQMIALKDGEQLDTALKRMDEAANLIDIDLSDFESKEPADPLEKHDEETGDTEADAGTTDTSDEDLQPADTDSILESSEVSHVETVSTETESSNDDAVTDEQPAVEEEE